MTPTPSAAQLLADLRALGIDLQHVGDAIRFRPRRTMTPALLLRLRMHKAELVAMSIIQQAHDLGDADLAEALAEAWGERVGIIAADGIPLAEAERTALAQLHMMICEINHT